MKANTKEILNNKAAKMIDLILDEIKDGGSKCISTSFTDEKADMNFRLDVQLTSASTKIESGDEGSIIDPMEEIRISIQGINSSISELTETVNSLSDRVSALEESINNT